jgi:hypothetical protein
LPHAIQSFGAQPPVALQFTSPNELAFRHRRDARAMPSKKFAADPNAKFAASLGVDSTPGVKIPERAQKISA